MVLLFAAYIIYVVFAFLYLLADYNGSFKIKAPVKITVSLLYLAIAWLALRLNNLATTHFYWVFLALLLCFVGDMAMLGAHKHKKAMLVGMGGFLFSHIILSVYFTRVGYLQTGSILTWQEALFIGAGFIAAIGFINNKRLDFGKPKFRAIVVIFFMSSVVMIVKAASLVTYLNTGVFWAMLIGVALAAFSDFFLAYKYFSTTKSTYALGAALALYYSGMAVLPLSILYI